MEKTQNDFQIKLNGTKPEKYPEQSAREFLITIIKSSSTSKNPNLQNCPTLHLYA